MILDALLAVKDPVPDIPTKISLLELIVELSPVITPLP